MDVGVLSCGIVGAVEQNVFFGMPVWVVSVGGYKLGVVGVGAWA